MRVCRPPSGTGRTGPQLAEGSPVRLVTIVGPGGVGKAACARRWRRRPGPRLGRLAGPRQKSPCRQRPHRIAARGRTARRRRCGGAARQGPGQDVVTPARARQRRTPGRGAACIHRRPSRGRTAPRCARHLAPAPGRRWRIAAAPAGARPARRGQPRCRGRGRLRRGAPVRAAREVRPGRFRPRPARRGRGLDRGGGGWPAAGDRAGRGLGPVVAARGDRARPARHARPSRARSGRREPARPRGTRQHTRGAGSDLGVAAGARARSAGGADHVCRRVHGRSGQGGRRRVAARARLARGPMPSRDRGERPLLPAPARGGRHGGPLTRPRCGATRARRSPRGVLRDPAERSRDPPHPRRSTDRRRTGGGDVERAGILAAHARRGPPGRGAPHAAGLAPLLRDQGALSGGLSSLRRPGGGSCGAGRIAADGAPEGGTGALPRENERPRQRSSPGARGAAGGRGRGRHGAVPHRHRDARRWRDGPRPLRRGALRVRTGPAVGRGDRRPARDRRCPQQPLPRSHLSR